MHTDKWPMLNADEIHRIESNDPYAYTYNICRQYFNQTRRALDIGCKFGKFAKEMVRDFDVVEAFDMRNKFRWKLHPEFKNKINFHNTAVGNKNGTIEYWGAVTGVEQLGKEKQQSVIVTVDSLNFDSIDFMKIDVEGDELSVLQGAKNSIEKFSPVIVLEQNAVTERVGKGAKYQAIEYLFSLDYEIVNFDGMSDWILKRK